MIFIGHTLSLKKLDFLYTIVARTGFAARPDVEHPEDLAGASLITACADQLPDFSDGEWREYIRAHLPFIIHNAIFGKDFPKDKTLTKLLLDSERQLRGLRSGNSPWLDYLYSAGQDNRCPSFEELSSTLDPATQTAFALDRPGFESVMESIATGIVDWCSTNRPALDRWHALQALQFA